MYQDKGAIISQDSKYRYELWRIWNDSLPEVTFIMLNPSTANANTDDPTIMKCVSFANRWGYGGIHVFNLFNYITPNRYDMLDKDIDPFGDRDLGNSLLMLGVIRGDKVICAWGEIGKLYVRAKIVITMLYAQCPEKINCLKVNRSGHPSHPLYLPPNLQPRPYHEIHKVLGGS